MAPGPRSGDSPLERYAPVVVVALLVGALLAPVAWHVSQPQPDGTVAVIELSSTITASTTQAVTEDLREARENESIEAVVLEVNSPGGSAAASEALYMAVNETASEMPVVASVAGTGASGAYYAMMPAEEIFTTPASLVGNVGVRATLPTRTNSPAEVTTGPDKIGGRTTEETIAQVESLHRAFVETVFAHRGDELDLTREDVAHAKVYTGVGAVNNGIADRIGGTGTAIDHAADLAGLENYDVTRKSSSPGGLLILASNGDNHTVDVRDDPFGFDGVETPTFLMLFGELEGQGVTVNATR